MNICVSRLFTCVAVFCGAALLPGNAPCQTTQDAAQVALDEAVVQGRSEPTGPWAATLKSADYVIHDFHFKDGEVMKDLRIHYYTLGSPQRDPSGKVTNAVLIGHGTGGSGRQFFVSYFSGVVFGPGQLLDAQKYYIIMADGIGHGHSSKPSEGLRMKFPKYDYDDMVAAQYALVTKGLGLNHLLLVMGTSMGCMHAWVWGETYPDFMDGLVPLACQPVEIAGRNRIMRRMIEEAITSDPDWKNGNYNPKNEPHALQEAVDILLLMGSAPVLWQKNYPTRDKADAYLDEQHRKRIPLDDANDTLYQVDASRNYNPEANLDKIQAQVLFINSADDTINPPELGIAEREIQKVKNGRFVLIPISDQTRGHSTHTRPALYETYLSALLNSLGH